MSPMPIPPGGIIHCPLCDTTFETPTPQYAPGVAAVFGMDAMTLASIHLQQDARRLESDLDRHFRTHGPTEWVPALMAARDRVSELEGQLAQMVMSS